MTNYGFTGRTLSKKLDEDTIRKGGLEQITAPVIDCKIASELELVTVEMGGYPTLVNYNIHREKKHKQLKQEKRSRSLKRQIKRFAGRQNGDELPSPALPHLDSCRGIRS
jgi:hypothetical protein